MWKIHNCILWEKPETDLGKERANMKTTPWTIIILTLVLAFPDRQAAGARIEGEIHTQKGTPYLRLVTWASIPQHIYPGDYTLKLLVGNENLGCSLRVGTKSSNARLLTISGPLAVRNVTDPIHFFSRQLRNNIRAL